jgi:hypothetical protein
VRFSERFGVRRRSPKSETFFPRSRAPNAPSILAEAMACSMSMDSRNALSLRYLLVCMRGLLFMLLTMYQVFG